jgi:hypothetical protein
MIAVSTAAELSQITPAVDHPRASDVGDLRDWLTDELGEVTSGWDRPGGLLGITKRRVQNALRCPASIRAEVEDQPMNEAMAVGMMVDAAASLLLMSDQLPGRAPWLGPILSVLRVSAPEMAEFVDRHRPDAKDDLRTQVEDMCEQLRLLLGDLRAYDGTAQESFRVQLQAPGVQLSGRTDLVLGTTHRSIIEVKSGRFRSHVQDELGFYALLAALRDDSAPVAVAAVTLDDTAINAYPVTHDLLEAAAQRVIDAAAVLVEVDRASVAGAWPKTDPGPLCAWCAAAPRCPDVADVSLAEFEAHRHDVDLIDMDEEEPW